MLDGITSLTPEEACGLLAGKGNLITQVFPVENILHSPTRYRMEPQQQLLTFQHIESLELELIAIYHSHPAGPAYPSPTDISEAYYPELAYIIISKSPDGFVAKGFFIQKQKVSEITLEFIE